MKASKALTLSVLTLAISSSYAVATEYDFSMNGYIKAGIIGNSDGNRVDSVGLMPDGKWRLGNEQNTKIELLPTIQMKAENGTIARIRANITHETTCTADWNCEDGDGKDVQFREGYAELTNLDFAPDVTFWAGKRYSSSNYSSHQYDWEFIQYNGTGGGFDNVDLGFARLDAGIYAFTPTSEGSQPPADISDQGYPEDYSIKLWLKQIADTPIDLQVVAHHMNNNVNRVGAAESGIGLTGVYTLGSFYGVADGFSKFVFQYGEGLAAGDSLGKNGWGWANLDDTRSWRGALDG
ncbi:carbohydrate porin, partial [Photobacterium sanctipauli]|uniref:carbohydrate porin n=1 Tax=Photobacterium sanctipauli TaxID=1342794 RepID=UPI00055C4001